MLARRCGSVKDARRAFGRSERGEEWLGSLGSNNKIDFAVKHLKQRQHLIDGLPVVGLVEQPIQLGGGGPEPSHDLALRERALGDSLLRFERQSVEQEISEV